MGYPCSTTLRTSGAWRAVAAALSVVAALSLAGTCAAFELIPSLGYMKSTDPAVSEGNVSGGLALRTALLPILAAEVGITYREESFSNDALKLRMWPVTTSLWLTPGSLLYVGGGLGWYRTTYDYPSSAATSDVTTNAVGMHLGGGLTIPMSPKFGLDLHGRYVFMQETETLQLPDQFDPDFWITSVGVTIKF